MDKKFDEGLFKKRLHEFEGIFNAKSYDFVCRYCDVRMDRLQEEM